MKRLSPSQQSSSGGVMSRCSLPVGRCDPEIASTRTQRNTTRTTHTGMQGVARSARRGLEKR
eukprot:1477219-Rhodomonas_salina.1